MAKATARRPAKEIIDDALRDNKSWEWLCFGLVVLLVATGVAVLITGIIQNEIVVAVTGGGVTGLFWPALGYARGFRRDNIRIRLFEFALSKADTTQEAAAILREAIGLPVSGREVPQEKGEPK